MSNPSSHRYLLAAAFCASACPGGDVDPLDTQGTAPTAGESTGSTANSTTTAATDGDPTAGTGSSTAGTGTTGVTGTTAGTTGSAGLVVTVKPDPPRSGSIAQLSATLDGQPVAVAWKLLGGPGTPLLTPEGAFTVPMSPGTWEVEATLEDDPQTSATGTIVADFRGGRPVSGWGNKSGGLWLYDGSIDGDWPGDLAADADNVFPVIRRTDQPNATILVSLVEASGDPQPGFGQGGIREFVVPNQGSLWPYSIGLTAERLYIAGDKGADDVLAAASPVDGAAIPGFGFYQPTHDVALPTPDPTAERLYLSTGGVSSIGVERLLADASVDLGWGVNGQLIPEIPASWDPVWNPDSEALDMRDLAVDGSGRLYVLMRSYDLDNMGRVAALLRYSPDGAPDPGFGVDGAVLWAINDKAGTDPAAMEIGEDGSIVVVGKHYGGWFGTRLLPDGAPDPGFGVDGNVTHPYQRNIADPAETAGRDLALLPGGYVVFLVAIDPANARAGLVRFTPDGEVDTDFGDADADGDGWSLIRANPQELVAGAEGRVFVMSHDVRHTGQLVERDVWVNAVHSY